MINKKNYYGLNGLGNFFFKEGNFNNAKVCFNEALKINKSNFYSIKKLGIVYYKLNDIHKATYLLEKAYRLKDNDYMLNRYRKKSNYYNI